MKESDGMRSRVQCVILLTMASDTTHTHTHTHTHTRTHTPYLYCKSLNNKCILCHSIHTPKHKSFYSLSEQVADLTIKLNNDYKMETTQAYTPTSAYDDEDVDRFYVDLGAAMELYKTQ